MEQERICHVTSAPDWSALPVIPIAYQRRPAGSGVEAFAQICRGEEQFFLRMWAIEKHIRAEITDPLGQVCQDSCLEFFFRPIPEDLRYFNIECNPNGCLFLGFGSCFDDLIRLYPLQSRICPEIDRREDRWEIFYTVPFSFIRQFFPDFAPEPGGVLRANFYKCGERTQIPHSFCWKPSASRPHGFHCPENFGTLIYE